MKTTLAAVFAAILLAATPAAACDRFFLFCFGEALSDDTGPPSQPRLPAHVHNLVVARDGTGLSLAGFYNDPALAIALYSHPHAYARGRSNNDPLVITSNYGHTPHRY